MQNLSSLLQLAEVGGIFRKMMLPIIFATTLFLVTEIQSQIIDCHKNQIGR